MARSEIAEKLAPLLVEPRWDEPLTVYFLVQLRKILDHRAAEEKTYPNLRFYCDWVVHISKDRVSESTISILKNLQDDIEKQITSKRQGTRAAIDFAYFEHLKPELISLIKEEGISSENLEAPDKWASFIAQLVKVLENQPLVIKPSHGLNISEIVFRPSNPRCVIMVANFVHPIKGVDGKDLYWFRLMNVY